MKILVPGGHGFVGKNVVEVLKKSTHNVFPLSRRDGFDLRDYNSAKNFIGKIKPDAIINCAAHVGSLNYVTMHAAEIVDDNMQIILNLYRAVKEICPRAIIINPISNCSYPGDADIQKEPDYWLGPVHKSVWSFGNSRRIWTVVGDCYLSQYNIKTINFFVPNSYGPGDYKDPDRTHALNGMIIRMLKAQQKNEPEFEIWGSGNPTREWIYVKDLAKILAGAIEEGYNYSGPINIAQNTAYSIKETAEMIKEAIGYKGKLFFNTKYQDGAPIKKMDDKIFRKKYPDFVFTEIKEGIKETSDYYKNINI